MLMADGNKATDTNVCICIYTASDALVLIKREMSTPYKPTARTKQIWWCEIKRGDKSKNAILQVEATETKATYVSFVFHFASH